MKLDEIVQDLDENEQNWTKLDENCTKFDKTLQELDETGRNWTKIGRELDENLKNPAENGHN